MIRSMIGLAVATTFVSLTGCGDDGPSRPDAMAAVAGNVAVPMFEVFGASATATATATDAVCADPTSATVDGAIAEVDLARESWLRTQAVWLGPVMDRRSAGRIDWTVDAAGIDELVAGSQELTAQLIADEVGSDNRGLRSLRSVLTRDDVVDLLSNERWCGYLVAAAAAVAEEGAALQAAWSEPVDGTEPFAAQVAGSEVNDWLAMLVDDAVQTVRVTTTEPSTEGDSPVPFPARDRMAQLQGVGAAMTELEPLLGDELDSQLQAALGAAITAYESGDIELGRTAATEVERLLTADVAGKLGVTIGFSDADGDGSG